MKLGLCLIPLVVAFAAPTKLQESYSKTVEKHVKASAKKADGKFLVHDDVLNKDWPLQMVRIHKDRIVELGDGRFFACADFKEKGGSKTPIDLDFYVKKDGDAWKVEQVLVHKVNGKARYTYNDNNERVALPQ